MPRGDECEEEAKLLQQMMLDLGFKGRLGRTGRARNWKRNIRLAIYSLLALSTSYNIFQHLSTARPSSSTRRGPSPVRPPSCTKASKAHSFFAKLSFISILGTSARLPSPAQHLLSCPTTGFQATPYLRLETSSFDEMQHDDMDVHIVFNFYYLTLFYRNWPRIQPPFRSLSSPTPGLKSLATGLAMATGRLFAKFHWLTLAPISTLFPIPFLFH